MCSEGKLHEKTSTPERVMPQQKNTCFLFFDVPTVYRQRSVRIDKRQLGSKVDCRILDPEKCIFSLGPGASHEHIY